MQFRIGYESDNELDIDKVKNSKEMGFLEVVPLFLFGEDEKMTIIRKYMRQSI